MAEDYKEGGNEIGAEGAEQSLETISIEELTAYPPRPERVDWAVTWYPVDMPQFRKLCVEAEKPDPRPQAAFEDESADSDADAEAAVETLEEDVGEEAMDPELLAPEALAPPRRSSFEGIPATGWQPPDCTIGVGQNDVVLAVNVDLAGYYKTGQLRFRWPNFTALFRNVLPAGAQLFDPRVAYDHYDNRWIVVIDARRGSPVGSWIMVGVSQTADPRGRYWVWALDATQDGSNATNNWADYTTVGFDTQGIYLSQNMFAFGGGFQYSKLRILSKKELYVGGQGSGHHIRWYDFWNLRNPDNSMAFTLQPCVHFRGRGGNPPAYLVNALWPGGNQLTMWTLSDPVAYWKGGRPRLAKDKVNCRSYSMPPDAKQKNSTTKIETNDTRLLNAIYQNVGGARRIWTAQTSRITWRGDSEARSAVQWYEIDVPGKKIEQQNGYGAKGKYYYFPAIQTDISRNAYVAFGRSSENEYASLRYTGRRVTAPKNDLENSAQIKAGESPYTGGRWGDYFGICRDAGNVRRVWCNGQFADARGRWGTWVGQLGY